MLLQSMAMVAMKLLGDDQVTPCVKKICLVGIICNVSNRKTSYSETFCFLSRQMFAINNLKLYFISLLQVTSFFFLRTADWPMTTFPEMDCYLPEIRLVNFAYMAAATVVAL